MKKIFTVAGKELKGYFGSPMAAIFIGAFLLFSLFFFFWVEQFFIRNSADIRPLFRWMPMLMIFLVATLTMRQWSEEQKMGTLEVLLTLPVRLWQLVLGKFLAVLFLVALALALTLGLPVTISLFGNLDWGPVIGGYLGTLLMAAAYIAIGLFVSSRTDNQIVALIVTVLIGGIFYLVGSNTIAGLFSSGIGDLLRSLGTGSRFASIERGVIDLRDVVYYVAVAAVFLVLNITALDMKRWSRGEQTRSYRRGMVLTVLLAVANLVLLNVWLNRAPVTRVDLTQNRIYSISNATRDLIDNLQEPLLLRGYFSEKSHPLLIPLVPVIRDLMTEYGIASGGKVEVEFVDPRFDEKAEIEANQQFNIQPIPFQVAGRYEAAVVNSYFHILVKYGDQYEVLDFRDLIEVEPRADGPPDVRLRNLEYDLTRTIKKVVYGFMSIGNIFEKIKQAELTAVITRNKLPQGLEEIPQRLESVVNDLKKESFGKLSYRVIDPDDGGVDRQQLEREYGVRPQVASLFSTDSFYFYLFLTVDGKRRPVHLGGTLTEAAIRSEIEAALKRNSAGFLKTVGIWKPTPEMPPQMAMMRQGPPDYYRMIQEILRRDYNVQPVTLTDGEISGNIDVLLLIAPQNLDDIGRLAVDQFLMRGGSLVVLGGRYTLDISPYSRSLQLKKVSGGVEELLTHWGIEVEQSLVMDERNEPFPVPVKRDLGGVIIQEIKRMDYPYFVDVRPDGMDRENPVTASLPAVTMNWVSPVTVDQNKNKNRKVSELLRSSNRSWLSDNTSVEPDYRRYPGSGFESGKEFKPALLAVVAQGVFPSYFSDRPDPRREKERREREKAEAEKKKKEDKESPADDKAETAEKKVDRLPPGDIVKESVDSAKLVVVGSSEFINDTVMSLTRGLGQDRFLNNLEFVQNLVDWAVEDEDLLTIRSRGGHARILAAMSRKSQRFWEIINYVIALGGLLLIAFFGGRMVRNEKPMQLIAPRTEQSA